MENVQIVLSECGFEISCIQVWATFTLFCAIASELLVEEQVN